jgi:hypothetical protein
MSQRWNDSDLRWVDVVPNRWKIFEGIPDYTEIMHNQIINDNERSWYRPVSNRKPYHDVFERCHMKFPLENYNTIDIESMIMLANNVPPYQYNWKPQFKIINQFIDVIRSIINEYGPLGKVSFWKIEPEQYIKEHCDDFPYHANVSRWIYNITHDCDNSIITMNGKKIESNRGTIFPFYTPTDYHYFKNVSNTDWYFLAIDFWNSDKLKSVTPDLKVMEEWKTGNRRHLIDNT